MWMRASVCWTRRTDDEQKACSALTNAFESELFKDGALHAEHSKTEGKDVVEQGGLGTAHPDNDTAKAVLDDVEAKRKALDAAMAGDDVFKQEYERMKKAGLSAPQIYMGLMETGLTQEQLAPLADYINAQYKALGMYHGTQQRIAEETQKHVALWGYKGELNGERHDGDQMVFARDGKGRVLLVGSGDVSFNGDGKALDTVGDMLIVMDTETGEMDFVSAKDVTLDHVESSEDYAKRFQESLEVRNSEPYVQGNEGEKPGDDHIADVNKMVGGENDMTSETAPSQPAPANAEAAPAEPRPTALGRVPKNDKGEPVYEQADPETAWDAIVEQAGGDEQMAKTVVDSMAANKEAALKKAEEAKAKGGTVDELIAAGEKRKQAIDNAEAELKHWQDIAAVAERATAGKARKDAEGGKDVVNDGKGGTDGNGNVLNSDGSVYTEKVERIDDISDNDFKEPSRSVELPAVTENVAAALGSNGKPIIIKKNIFEKNLKNHPEQEPEDSRVILGEALYNPNIVGQTQPKKRPSYKVAVRTGDKNSIVVLDVYEDKKQIEIVGWRRIDERGLEKMKRQAEREGGQFLILSPKEGSAAALSALPNGSSSVGKDSEKSSTPSENKQTLTSLDDIPLDKDGEPQYESVPKEKAVESLYGTLDSPEEVSAFVEAKVEEATKKVGSLAKKAPKMGTKVTES